MNSSKVMFEFLIFLMKVLSFATQFFLIYALKILNFLIKVSLGFRTAMDLIKLHHL